MSIDPSIIIHNLLSSSSRVNDSDLILLQCINMYDIYKIYISMSLLPTPTDHLLPLLILPTWGWWHCDLAHTIKVRLSKVLGRLPQLPHWLAFIMFGLQLPRSYWWAAVVCCIEHPYPTFPYSLVILQLTTDTKHILRREGGGAFAIFYLWGLVRCTSTLITPFLPFLQIRSL